MDLEEKKYFKHFSHDHSLLLKREQLDDGTDVSCTGCLQPIKGQSFGCKGCMFFLHISCAALPKEITHPYHPQHPLSLLPNPPNRYSGCICDVCWKQWDRFVYRCSACDFDVDIKCASMVVHIQKKIKHQSHPQHELIPLQKLITFLCDACGTTHRDTSYLCTTCGFWISQKCAALPTTIQLIPDHHHHPLTLIYSVPKHRITCGICHREVCRRNWVYWCSESECKYIVHVNNNAIKSDTEEPSTLRDCKTMTKVHDPSQISLFIDSDVSDIRTTNFNNETKTTDEETVPLQLPLPDHESIDLTISEFIEDTGEDAPTRPIPASLQAILDSQAAQIASLGTKLSAMEEKFTLQLNEIASLGTKLSAMEEKFTLQLNGISGQLSRICDIL